MIFAALFVSRSLSEVDLRFSSLSTLCSWFQAVSVDTVSNTVKFKDGESMEYNKLLVATGGR